MLITVFALTASVGSVAAQEAEPVELSSNVQTTTSGGEGLAYRNTTDAGYQLNKSFTFGSILYNTTTDACTGVQTTYLWYEVNYTNRGRWRSAFRRPMLLLSTRLWRTSSCRTRSVGG